MAFNNPGLEKIVREGGRWFRRRHVFFRLKESLVYSKGGVVIAIVPAGFVSDLASVPFFLWWIYPPAGLWMFAAIMHDWLYLKGLFSRFLSDALFREAMEDDGVSVADRVAFYYAVRIAGRRHYRKAK